jgi:hypothetical protein
VAAVTARRHVSGSQTAFALLNAIVDDDRFRELGTSTQAVVLVAAIKHANRDGVFFAKHGTIGNPLELSADTVGRRVRSAVKVGLLSRTRRRREDGRLGVYVYAFAPEVLARRDEILRAWQDHATETSGGRLSKVGKLQIDQSESDKQESDLLSSDSRLVLSYAPTFPSGGWGPPDVRGFYAELDVVLPRSHAKWARIRCFLPDHPEKNPSAQIDTETGGFVCFSCDAKGGALQAAIALGLPRGDAAELVKKYGLWLERAA